MNKKVKNLLNGILEPLDIGITRANTVNHINQNYASLVEEVHELFLETIFPDLPNCDGRIELMTKLLGTNISEAMYILQYLHKSLNLEGDVCEFGIAQGSTSALIANEIRKTEKNLWLFDSFQGLSKPTEKDLLLDDIYNFGSMDKYEGAMSNPVASVQTRLKEISYPLSKVKIVPGFIEDTIAKVQLSQKVCFAYIDFDLYNPILVGLNFLDKYLSVGGYVIVDDYGFFSSGAKTAVDEFIASHQDRYKTILPHQFAGHFIVLHKQA
ncbi:MAG: TylF/MycF/NovP-related O-methyltransferase [Xenococcaceae cyanobacterium]